VFAETPQLWLLPDPAERSADDAVEAAGELVDEVEAVAAEPEPAHAASIRVPEYV
jgi:hypothetical protein